MWATTASTAAATMTSRHAPGAAKQTKQNRAIAGGSCATVGITGLTLGGGVGVLVRTSGQVSLCHVTFVAIGGMVEDATGSIYMAMMDGGLASITDVQQVIDVHNLGNTRHPSRQRAASRKFQ